MTQVNKLYKTWRKKNKQFFHRHFLWWRRNSVKENYFNDAKQSLLDYLRKNDMTLNDVNFALTEKSYAWDLITYSVSSITGLLGGIWISDDIMTRPVTILTIITVIIMGFIGMRWLSRYIQNEANACTLSGTSLLQMTLQEYKEMYGNAINTASKLIQLYPGQWISIPCNAALLYDGQPQQPEYYNHALLVNVKHHDMTFKYIWFTNANYPLFHPHTLYRFIDVCAQQIGHNWAPSSANTITFEKLKCNDIHE